MCERSYNRAKKRVENFVMKYPVLISTVLALAAVATAQEQKPSTSAADQAVIRE